MQPTPWFPNLRDYSVTSEATSDYNCFAWVFGDTKRWYDPRTDLGYYWPIESEQDVPTVHSLTALFDSDGYEDCTDGSLEPGYEKVALYAISENEATHAARQLNDGRWSSKLGHLEDITHMSPTEVQCGDYGTVFKFMRRRKSAEQR